METNSRFDAHCHIFTLKYAIKEVKSMVHDVLHGTYPWHDPAEKAMFSATDKLSLIKDFIKQLYELIHAAGSSEEENLNFLQNEAKKVFPDDQHLIIPLMMDIFYMLAYPLNENQDLPNLTSLKAVRVDEKEYQAYWNDILDDFKQYLHSKDTALKASRNNILGKKTNQVLQIIEQERSVSETLRQKTQVLKLTAIGGFYETEGYCYHMNNLTDLVNNRKGELYPFVAIDPRRKGIIDTLLGGKFIGADGPFYGVKLYPRMGFHPLSKPMDAVYKYCSDNKIPIIFHCGMGGFPPSTTWKYAEFGNPLNFEPVVQKYQNLKIDFAHLGSSDDTYAWAKTIIRMVNEYDNVYSDLSCYTDIDDLKRAKGYWNYHPKLKTRLMFGTDFDVMYFTGKITMQDYYKNFQSIFDPNELKILMHDNPKNFMGITP